MGELYKLKKGHGVNMQDLGIRWCFQVQDKDEGNKVCSWTNKFLPLQNLFSQDVGEYRSTINGFRIKSTTVWDINNLKLSYPSGEEDPRPEVAVPSAGHEQR